jgi:uncharacterized protein YdaU (DUF1376 family)
MSRGGLPYMPLDVDDWLDDAAIVAMSAAAEGCYIRLLCRSWKSRTPGVIPIGLVPELAGMHRLPEGARQSILRELATAFRIDAECWIQRRMVTEWKRATERYKGLKRGADKTNAVKSVARPAYAQRPPSVRQAIRLAGRGLGVGSKSDSEKPLTPILSRLATSETAPTAARESTPIASDPVQVNGKATAEPDRIPPAAYQDGRESFRCSRCGKNAHRRIGEPREVCAQCWAATLDSAAFPTTPA